MYENKKTSSIARKINWSFWSKKLFDTIGLNIVIIALTVLTFGWWRYNSLPNGYSFDCFRLVGATYKSLSCLTVTTDGTVFAYRVHEFFDYVLPAFGIILIFEIVDLFFAMFRTGAIRRKLRPLNDLAIRAEQISSVPLDADLLEHLEHAITHVAVDSPDAKVSTGDEDLRSIEVALNNLIARMQETKQQQARFVSDASHELRTPISVIQGYVNMLDRWGKEDENVLNESIEALKHESEHMKILIEQLLFLARGDSGRNTLNKINFSLGETIKEVWEESLMIDEKHQYRLSQPEDKLEGAFMMYGDFSMIKQSIRIFVQNASKYSPDGGIITLGVIEGDTTVSYRIQDEGIGMQESEVSHIFERFYRSDVARNGSSSGSGLGLSIAKWIIEAHDGTINVLSRPDIGTRFTITFPKHTIEKNS